MPDDPQVIVASNTDSLPFQGVRIHNFPNPTDDTVGFIHDWRRSGGNPSLALPLRAVVTMSVGPRIRGCDFLDDAQVTGLVPGGLDWLPTLGLYEPVSPDTSYTIQPGLPAGAVVRQPLAAPGVNVSTDSRPLVAGDDYLAQNDGENWVIWLALPTVQPVTVEGGG
jgi:hypothetical protein